MLYKVQIYYDQNCYPIVENKWKDYATVYDLNMANKTFALEYNLMRRNKCIRLIKVDQGKFEILAFYNTELDEKNVEKFENIKKEAYYLWEKDNTNTKENCWLDAKKNIEKLTSNLANYKINNPNFNEFGMFINN